MSVRPPPPNLGRYSSDPISSAQAPKRKNLYEDERRDAIVKKRTDPKSFLQSVVEDQRVVLALDLDQCSFVGQDGCDILTAIGQLTDGFTKDKTRVMEIAKQLVNPNLKPAFEDLKKRYLDPLVVIYTAKGGLVKSINSFFSERKVYDQAVKLNSDTLMFKMEDISRSSFKYLTKQIEESLPVGVESSEQMKRAMDRLGLTTFAIALVLGLPYTPAVFVTKASKDLNVISSGMGVPVNQIYLFDDKAAEHASKMGISQEQAHMITVPEYNLSTFDAERGRLLQESLRTYFPIDTSKFGDSFTRRVMYAGRRAPYGMQSIDMTPKGLDWDLSSLSKRPITNPTVGYPMSQLPDPEQPQAFREPYSLGRSFSHIPPATVGSTLGFFPYMNY